MLATTPAALAKQPSQPSKNSVMMNKVAAPPTRIRVPAPPTAPLQTPSHLPPYLHTLLNQLDWVGQDLDNLVMTTGTDIATLTGWLVELELMGHAMQRGGLYMRCRS